MSSRLKCVLESLVLSLPARNQWVLVIAEVSSRFTKSASPFRIRGERVRGPQPHLLHLYPAWGPWAGSGARSPGPRQDLPRSLRGCEEFPQQSQNNLWDTAAHLGGAHQICAEGHICYHLSPSSPPLTGPRKAMPAGGTSSGTNEEGDPDKDSKLQREGWRVHEGRQRTSSGGFRQWLQNSASQGLRGSNLAGSTFCSHTTCPAEGPS